MAAAAFAAPGLPRRTTVICKAAVSELSQRLRSSLIRLPLTLFLSLVPAPAPLVSAALFSVRWPCATASRARFLFLARTTRVLQAEAGSNGGKLGVSTSTVATPTGRAAAKGLQQRCRSRRRQPHPHRHRTTPRHRDHSRRAKAEALKRCSRSRSTRHPPSARPIPS